MGAVHEAEHTFLGRRVAIKVLSAEFAHNAEAVRRFYREAQAAARIGHENICEVTDVGQAGSGEPYIVMQLLQGKSLSAAITESAPFPVGRAVDIASQALDALAAAHAAGIVHRDMKPDNIFLTRVAGRDDFVKLLDFGISKVRVASGRTKLTQEGSVLGTPQYMAPEQARGETDVDGRADIWAVGVVLFEMLTGRIPFDGDNYNKILFNVMMAPIPRLRALRPGLSAEVEFVVMRAMERDLDRRYRTAAELRDALGTAWMGTKESGFAVRSMPSDRPPIADEATELAPALMLVQIGRNLPIASPIAKGGGRRAPTDGPAAAPAAVSAVFVAEPMPPESVASSPSGPPTAPRTRSPVAGLQGHGRTVPTPAATHAPPTMMRSPMHRRVGGVPLIPAAVFGVALLGIVVFALVRFLGASDDEPLADATVAVAAVTADATAAADSTDTGGGPGASDAGTTATADSPPPVDAASATLPPDASAKSADVGPEPDVPAAPVEPMKVTDGGDTVDAETAGIPTPPDVGATRPRPMGAVSVVTSPVTQVLIDGRPIGRAPILNREIGAGSHTITFVNETYGIRREERLLIVEGRLTEIRRSAEQLGVVRQPARDGGTVSAPVDAGAVLDGIRIRRRDAR